MTIDDHPFLPNFMNKRGKEKKIKTNNANTKNLYGSLQEFHMHLLQKSE